MKRSPSPEYVYAHRNLVISAEEKVEKHRRFVEDTEDGTWKSVFSKGLLRGSENDLLVLKSKHKELVRQCSND